jgi:tetratricopeptide (TPR) repeat protein
MFRKYVKVPLVEEGLRLDTVIRSGNGEIIYDYVQTINTRPKLKKAEIVLSGDIFEQEKKIYSMPPSQPLTFYISSIGWLVDEREKYLTKIMERKVELNTACYIDFKVNSSDIIASMGKNSDEIARIKANFVSLMQNEEFDLDSVIVKASCSPEGSFSRNRRLSKERSDAVSKYFNSFMKHWSDSVARENGLVVDMDGRMSRERIEPVRFISRSDPENWRMLDALISKDSVLTEGERKKYASLSSIEDPDSREMELRSLDNYRYIREKLYPRLRTVRFDFHLHRKGMLQDTVKTTVIDSVYMAGVKAIKDSDYEKAVQLLRPYKDFNSALAYCAMDYNATALKILESIDRTDKVNYMLAILYSRRGDYRSAVECYLRACSQNRHFVHRGNLDPEISDLIKKYGLNKEEGI